ncbi:MAG: VPLPA-CTERM sorting domain-containing protein [Pseudomonadota bacterium]
MSGNLVGTSTGVNGPWWQHDAPITEKLRGTKLGSTGYNFNETYTFDLIFSADRIQVKVNDVVEIDYTKADNGGKAFGDGAFGFYNFSQARVTYGSLVEDTDPDELAVPLPAGLPLLLAGLGVLGLAKRRQKA